MRSVVILTFSACLLVIASCVKPKEPRARICPEEPLTITTKDTLVLENCSENYETQRWDLPSGAVSSQNSVAFTSSIPGTYYVTLKVSNNEYANDYVAERKIEVILP